MRCGIKDSKEFGFRDGLRIMNTASRWVEGARQGVLLGYGPLASFTSSTLATVQGM